MTEREMEQVIEAGVSSALYGSETLDEILVTLREMAGNLERIADTIDPPTAPRGWERLRLFLVRRAR